MLMLSDKRKTYIHRFSDTLSLQASVERLANHFDIATYVLPLCQTPVFQFFLGNIDHIHQHLQLRSIDHLQTYSAVYDMHSRSDNKVIKTYYTFLSICREHICK